MEYGPHIDRLEKIEEETGETPSMLESRPDMPLASHAMIFQCFMTMHMMRTSNGWGANPITMKEINDYEHRFGKMPIDDDLFIMIIKQCDEAALAWIRKKQDEKSSKEKVT